jgi:hypothetical protein
VFEPTLGVFIFPKKKLIHLPQLKKFNLFKIIIGTSFSKRNVLSKLLNYF